MFGLKNTFLSRKYSNISIRRWLQFKHTSSSVIKWSIFSLKTYGRTMRTAQKSVSATHKIYLIFKSIVHKPNIVQVKRVLCTVFSTAQLENVVIFSHLKLSNQAYSNFLYIRQQARTIIIRNVIRTFQQYPWQVNLWIFIGFWSN